MVSVALDGIPAAADRGAPHGVRDVDREGPGAVARIGTQTGAAGLELVAVGIAAAAAAVDPASVGGGTHDDHFQSADTGTRRTRTRPLAAGGPGGLGDMINSRSSQVQSRI